MTENRAYGESENSNLEKCAGQVRTVIWWTTARSRLLV